MNLPGYQIESPIWDGRASRVVRATRESDELIVLATIFEGGNSDELDAVRRESALLKETDTYHILPAIDASTRDDGAPVVIYPDSGGRALRDVLTEHGGLPIEVVTQIAIQIGRSLQAAHGKGVRHGDLGPQHIYVAGDDGTGLVRVGRFCAHHLLPAYSRQSKTDNFFGTPEYMAPEICSGKPVDERADIYSLGIVVYEAVTGKAPFASKSYTTTLKRQIYEKPLPLHLVKPGAANINELEKIVSKAVQKDPKQRYATIDELVAELEGFFQTHYPDLNVPNDPGGADEVIAEPEPIAEPQPVAEPEPAVEPELETVPEPAAEPEPKEAEAEPEPETTAVLDESSIVDSIQIPESKRPKTVKEKPPASIPGTLSATSSEATDALDSPGTLLEVIPGGVPEDPSNQDDSGADHVEQRPEEMEDWFVAGAGDLPEDEGTSVEMEYPKKSRTFLWVSGIAALLVVGGVWYITQKMGKDSGDVAKKPDGREVVAAKDPATPASKEIEPTVAPKTVEAPAKAPSPKAAAEKAAAPDGDKVPAAPAETAASTAPPPGEDAPKSVNETAEKDETDGAKTTDDSKADSPADDDPDVPLDENLDEPGEEPEEGTPELDEEADKADDTPTEDSKAEVDEKKAETDAQAKKKAEADAQAKKKAEAKTATADAMIAKAEAKRAKADAKKAKADAKNRDKAKAKRRENVEAKKKAKAKKAKEAAKKKAKAKKAKETAKKKAAATKAKETAKKKAAATKAKETAKKKGAAKKAKEAAKMKAAAKKANEAAKKKAVAKKKTAAAKKPAAKTAADNKAKAKRYISLGIKALKKNNPKLAIGFFRRAKSLDKSNQSVNRYIGLAQRKLKAPKGK